MKKMKRLTSLILVLVMVFALSSTVFAAGTNSITVDNAKPGEKYNIYKMLDLSVDNETTPTAYRYTINAKWRDFWVSPGPGAAYIDTNTAGSVTYVVWKSDKQSASDMEAFGKAAAKWISDNSISADATEVTATETGAQFTGLDNGYYLVTSTYGTATSVASTPADPAQTIVEKNNENTVEKKVQENEERNGATASWAASNDAAIGDTITFRTKVTIAKNSTNVVYHDTMGEALTFTGVANVKVYTDEACATELSLANYSVAEGTGGETFTVTFTNEYVSTVATSTDVYVKYTATLNGKAVVGTDVKNSGQVKWGAASASAVSETSTSTHSFEILKYDATDTAKNPLKGAKFQLFTQDTGGTAVKLAVSTDGLTYRVIKEASDIPSGYTAASDDKIVTLSTGNITIEGVDSDDYWLEETDAPLGYTKLTNRQKVQVDAANNLIAEVENKSGTTLPTTGGIGTTIFYIVGAVLVLGAVVLLVTKKRMNSAER